MLDFLLWWKFSTFLRIRIIKKWNGEHTRIKSKTHGKLYGKLRAKKRERDEEIVKKVNMSTLNASKRPNGNNNDEATATSINHFPNHTILQTTMLKLEEFLGKCGPFKRTNTAYLPFHRSIFIHQTIIFIPCAFHGSVCLCVCMCMGMGNWASFFPCMCVQKVV